ncbi:lysophospholipid acyltransferase family protein [Nonomuraea jiangxiensis]|uniref:1-acyl-sn-glycerol-3-phosphate acyltransferases n=1 Tax=Nonomuraea jiangxiensis TaxID=633440 RepID=A0A1G9DE62_9ACTN|nr:lysophospholipid acyltransferase family protein [Nonomuraea jiangxiensis]SDK62084.1 1-acyl-sn-glycerol-3-phosphate acyltransferases [Nonomuraea jiangxiensis]
MTATVDLASGAPVSGAARDGAAADAGGISPEGVTVEDAASAAVSGAVSVPVAQVNPWRPSGPCSTDACVQDAVAVAGSVRRVARLLAAVLVVLAGLPMSLVASRMSASRRAKIVGGWARLLLRALGIRIEADLTALGTTTGVDPADAVTLESLSDAALRSEPDAPPAPSRAPASPGTGALVVANHISWLDPLVLAATIPSRALAKREIAGWPIIRTLLAGSGALLIDRERLSQLPAAVRTIADALSAGDTVVAFPEGTTWCGRGMGRFRPAVFQAALDANAPVRPVMLRYREGKAETASTRACYVGDDSLVASALRVAATRRLVVQVTLYAPVRLMSPAPRPVARAVLAEIAEAQVRTGIADGHPV